MANTKGKGRRVADSDEEEGGEGVQQNGSTEEDERSSRPQRTASKGKGRAQSPRRVAATRSSRNADVVIDDDSDEETGQRGNGDSNGQQQDEEMEEPELDAANDLEAVQDINEKRDVRKKYRDMTTTLMTARANDPAGVTIAALTQGVEMANEVFKTVQGPAEAVLDSNYLMMTGDLAMQAARKLKIGGDYFDTDDFITKLKGAITGGVVRRNANASPRRSNQRSQANASDDEDADYENNYQDPYVGWDRIGKLATKHTLRVPPIDFMLGPLAIPQRKKTVRKKQAREKDVAEKVRPQEIGQDDIQEDENAAPKLVMEVAEILEREGGQEGVNLFHFLINPQSYTQTVENIFYTSFLIKEKRAAIDYDEDEEPVIYACLPPDEEQKKEGVRARQLILEMDMQMWKDAIEAYDITESIIPTRKYVAVQKGKWYG